jgi:hypothetical protein
MVLLAREEYELEVMSFRLGQWVGRSPGRGRFVDEESPSHLVLTPTAVQQSFDLQ